MENSRLRTIIFLTIVSLFALMITSGCLETSAATPAEVSSEALSEYGWVQADDVTYESQEEEISGTVITVNTAMIRYQDEQLGEEIIAKLWDLQSQYNMQMDVQIPTIGSQLMTLRVVLPGGFALPSGITSSLIDSQIENLAKDNSIENFRKVGTQEITVKDGSSVTANTYAGTVAIDGDMDGASISVMAIVAPWSSSGTNIFAIGIVPDGDINMKMGPIEKTLITIDGNAEIEDMLELIKTIE